MEPSFDYNPLPTLYKFHKSNALVKGIRGPVGSGKTVGCCFDLVKIGCLQPAYKGVRYVKFAMVRNTYQELLQTTLETWSRWFGDYSQIRRTAPIEARMRVELRDKTILDLWLIFLALDIPADLRKLKSLEVTGSYLNEASEMGRWVLTKTFERRGRYPDFGPPPWWAGVIMDTNSCDDDHWWYKASEEEHNQGWEFFDQPPALLKFSDTVKKPAKKALDEYLVSHPDFPPELTKKIVKDLKGNLYIANPVCENANHQPLGFDYWLDQIPGKPLDEITVFVLNQYGTVTDAKAVYPEYTDSIHCSKEVLKPIKDIGISLGFDFGRTPACTLSQITPKGQKRVLEEFLVEEHGSMGIRAFSRTIVVPHLLDNYLDWLIKGLITGYADPAGKSKEQTDEKTCFMVLNESPVNNPKGGITELKRNRERLKNDSWVKKLKQKAAKGEVSIGDLGIQIRPARTNSFEARTDAVSNMLTSYIDKEPALLLSQKVKYLRKGMRGKYCYRRVQVSGPDARYKDEPDKNIFSHICEALQYDCLESYFMAADPGEKEREEEEKHRKEIGSASCAAWDELKEIKKAIEDGEYDEYMDDLYFDAGLI